MSNYYLTSTSRYYVEGCSKQHYKTSDCYYRFDSTWQMERNLLAKNHAHLLNILEANQLNIQNFFIKNEFDDKPHLNRDYHYLTFPYELDDEILPENNEVTATVLISKTLNSFIQGQYIYIASTDSDKCCVIECYQLNDEIIHIPTTPHMNTPFLIFTEKADIFALIDYDLPLQIIGYKPHLKVEIPYYDEIQQGFDTVLERYRSYTNMPNLFRTYYDFLLPKWFKY